MEDKQIYIVYVKKFDNTNKYALVTGAAELLGKMHVEALLRQMLT